MLESNKGELILVRRPVGEFQADDYGPCCFCMGFFLKSDIAKHQTEHCHFKQGPVETKLARLQSEVLLGKHLKASEMLKKKIIPSMHNDEIKEIAVNDELIVELGNSWARKSRGNKAKGKHNVSQELRQCWRYLRNL